MNKETENSRESYEKLQNQLRSVSDTFSPQEQDVLKMRFGLETGYSLTLDEVALYFGISREQIRQIEAKALRRLRLSKQNNNEEIMSIMSSLTKKEQEIVKMKFGLDSGIKATDDEIIMRFHNDNLSKEDLAKIMEKVNRRIEHKPDEIINIPI